VCYPHFYQKTQRSEEVGGLKGALTLGQALEKALAPGKAPDVDDVGDFVPGANISEPDQERTPEKAIQLTPVTARKVLAEHGGKLGWGEASKRS